MKKIQRVGLKFLIIIFSVLIIANADAQSSSHRLAVADSLFKGKQYTQSLSQYQNILSQKQYSPAMLLKMAYIEEGLNNIGKAMYYLNLYFLASNDKSVITKMEDMAKKFNLEGYKTTDADQFLSFYHDYHFYITVFLAALSILIISTIFYVRVKRKRRPIAAAIFLVAILAIFCVHVNFGERITTAIVSVPDTYIMKGPSAGAPVVTIIDEGHRVEVIGKHDVWLRIRWNGEIAYVKSNSLLPIQF